MQDNNFTDLAMCLRTRIINFVNLFPSQSCLVTAISDSGFYTGCYIRMKIDYESCVV